MKGGGQPGVRPGKEDGILREPLQGRLRGEGQLLAQKCLCAAAAVKLAGARHGYQGMAAGIKVGANRQFITADDAAGGVKQIEVTGLFFRVKRALDGQRADVLGAGENGLAAGLLKAQIQRGLPAFFEWW
ncbi:hypothetical protein NUKP28_34210 [Klebsiella quasipneumoniae]|nr:hypothetical protein NUKP28_34210 [Klebsiella quasipneumoniae]